MDWPVYCAAKAEEYDLLAAEARSASAALEWRDMAACWRRAAFSLSVFSLDDADAAGEAEDRLLA